MNIGPTICPFPVFPVRLELKVKHVELTMSNSSGSTAPSEYLHTLREPDRNSEHARYPIEYARACLGVYSLLTSVSIVFVHGLNPLGKVNFAELTWTHDNGNFWPVKQLPQRIPSARIHIFSYNSRVAWDTSTNGIQQHANNLLDRLLGAREDRPIEVRRRTTNQHETD